MCLRGLRAGKERGSKDRLTSWGNETRFTSQLASLVAEKGRGGVPDCSLLGFRSKTWIFDRRMQETLHYLAVMSFVSGRGKPCSCAMLEMLNEINGRNVGDQSRRSRGGALGHGYEEQEQGGLRATFFGHSQHVDDGYE